jgi:hypothetical protein
MISVQEHEDCLNPASAPTKTCFVDITASNCGVKAKQNMC